jgi:hypothetical protein
VATTRSGRRRCSRNAGKYDPARSFGIASSIVPARVSYSRRQYPLREFTRSGVTSPYPAFHRTSTSASIIRCANSRTISRSTIRARRCQGLLELGARDQHNVTCGYFALLRCSEATSKDREVATSLHGDTPYSG